MRIVIAGAAAAALAAATAAAAAPANRDFQDCDGYRQPGPKTDGITGYSGNLLVRSGPSGSRTQSAWGEPAVAACDRALADAALESRYWMRRASLLQSKAMHLLVARKDDEALAALAEAEAAAAPHKDPLVAESLALGNRALRAMALYRLNRGDEARSELDALRAARPYSSSVRSLARSLALLYAVDSAAYLAALKQDAPLQPDLLQPMFRLSLMTGELDASAPLYAQISHDLPKTRSGWRLEGAEDRRYEAIGERAELAGTMAYVLQAQGKAEAAAALMASARSELDDALQPPEPDKSGRIGKKAAEDYERRKAAGAAATGALDRWAKAAALRASLKDVAWRDLPGRAQADLPEGMPVMLDLVGAATTRDDAERSEQKAVLAMLRATLERERAKAVELKFSDLAKLLPPAEAPNLRPRYRAQRSSLLWGDINGATAKKHDGEEWTVGFGSGTATPATVEELALLTAALKTREAGKDSFLIESRLLVQRSYQIGYGKNPVLTPAGREVRLRIRPVASTALPPELEGARWRLIDANDVIRQLEPKYQPAPAPAG